MRVIDDNVCEASKLYVKDKSYVNNIDEVINIVSRFSYVSLECLENIFRNEMTSQDFGNLCKHILNSNELIVTITHHDEVYFSKVPKKSRQQAIQDKRMKNFRDEYEKEMRGNANPNGSEHSKRSSGCVGLMNLGNTCFMNSVLQCLFSNSIVAKYFIEDFKIDENNKDTLPGRFAGLVGRCWAGKERILIPCKFRKLWFHIYPENKQQDCHEFLLNFLNNLHDSLKEADTDSNMDSSRGLPGDHRTLIYEFEAGEVEIADLQRQAYEAWTVDRHKSIINDTFKGLFMYTMECCACHDKSVSFDSFHSLSLPIPQELSVTLLRLKGEAERFVMMIDRNLSVARLKDDVKMKDDGGSMKESDAILIAEVHDHYIVRILDDQMIIKDFNPDNRIYALQVYTEELVDFGSNLQNVTLNSSLNTVPCNQSVIAMEVDSDSEQATEDWIKKPIGEMPVEKTQDMTSSAPSKVKDIRTCELCRDRMVDGSLEVCQCSVMPADVDPINSLKDAKSQTSMIRLNVMYRSGSELFGHPNVIHLPRQTTGNKLYLALQCIHAFRYGDKFKVVTTDKQGLKCSRCPTSNCTGCELKKENPCIVFQPEDHLTVTFFDLTEKDLKEANAVSCYQMEAKTLSLLDCIESFMASEIVTRDCPTCKKSNNAKKTMTVWKYPNTLIVHLMRYSVDRLLETYGKIDSEINFPFKDLNLSFSFDDADDRVLYELQSYVCHIGDGPHTGHYTTLAKHPVSEEWIRYSDDKYKKEDPSEADFCTAYLLFYQRKGSSETFELPEDDDECSCHTLPEWEESPRGDVFRQR